jgi:hypothetical protein
MRSLNQAYSRLGTKRRYESWFLRFGLADGTGAWWIRYLLTNPGREGCSAIPGAAPAQVWATWFPCDARPETVIQEFPVTAVKLSERGQPFSLEIGPNRIGEDGCCGSVEGRGQRIAWDLRCRSRFSFTISNKGWIGFSRTPHSDGIFSGEIRSGEQVFRGDPLGVGVQGHNCGFRHRDFWTWMHACFPQPDGSLSTLEALVYEMPFGLRFRKAILWHRGQKHRFRNLREGVRTRDGLRWNFEARSGAGVIDVEVDGGGHSLHQLPYAKTDCSGTFEVSNNSRARVQVHIRLADCTEDLVAADGAVLEMAGDY